MKKMSILSILLFIFFFCSLVLNLPAQQEPPLLTPQNQMVSPPPPTPPIPGNLPLPNNPPLDKVRQVAPVPPVPPVAPTIDLTTLLSNLQKAVITIENVNKLLSAGKVWLMHLPAGEIEIKGGILYKGNVVAVIHFNPLNGKPLPIGINPHIFQSNVNINLIKNNLLTIINNLKILSVAEFIEPESCWSFPVSFGNIIVAHVKIYYDGVHVIKDYIADQEMKFYGQ